MLEWNATRGSGAHYGSCRKRFSGLSTAVEVAAVFD